FVELSDGKERMPAAIHKAHRLDEQHIAASGRARLPLCRSFPGRTGLCRDLIDHHETNIVTRDCVLRTGITKASNKTDRVHQLTLTSILSLAGRGGREAPVMVSSRGRQFISSALFPLPMRALLPQRRLRLPSASS